MKIRNLFLAVMTLVLTVTGCSKVDTPAADNDLKFVFEMADKDGFGADTKAVKTGWAKEDMVYILFKPTGAEECLVSKIGDKKYPQYATTTYRYDEETYQYAWVWINNVEVEDLGTGGKYYAIHHRGSIDMDDKTGMGKDCFPLNSYAGGELLSYVGDYTVDGNTVNLGVIRMKMDERIFQVSIGMQLWTTSERTFWLNDFYENDRVTSIDGYHDEWIEESVVMSIYIDETLDNPGWVSLQPGAVSVDLTDEKIFVYNKDYEEDATAVLNYDDDSDINDVSFYFADYNGIKPAKDFYGFFVKRYHSEHGEYYYPEDLRSFYLFVDYDYKDRKIVSGNAYRLPVDGWKL